jgi:plasmid replication initiation protein
MLDHFIPYDEDSYRLLVRKSNKLINSRNTFTTLQNRILLLMLVAVKENQEEDFDWIEIPIQKVIDAKGKKTPKGAQYQQVKASAIEMSSSALYIRQENGKWKTMPLMKADGDDKSGTIRVKFVDDPDTKDVVYNIFLKGGSGYTSYLLDIGLSFKKKYTLRIYEKLKRACNQQHKDRITVELNIETLKFELYLEKKYPNNSDFKKWVMEPSVKEINKLSDLSVKYQPNKSRKPTTFIFFVERKAGFSEGIQDIPYEEMEPAAKPALKPAETQQAENDLLETMAQKHGKEYTDFCWHQVQLKTNVQNKVAYLKKALQEGYFKEEYQARKSQQDKKQESQVMQDFKIHIEAEFKAHYSELTASALSQITPFDEQQYIQQRRKSQNAMWRKYAREIEEGNASHLAKNNLAVWYIEEHGTGQQKQQLSIANFAKDKFGVDWEKLID